MTDTQLKKDTNTKVVNPLVAGIAGAVIGGAAVAASMVMSDKKNRDKVGKVLMDKKSEVKDKVIKEVQKV